MPDNPSSDTLGIALLKALGVPTERCYRARIAIVSGCLMSVEAHYYILGKPTPDDPAVQEFETEVRRFHLVEDKEEADKYADSLHHS